MGVREFVTKPFDVEYLRNEIQRLLGMGKDDTTGNVPHDSPWKIAPLESDTGASLEVTYRGDVILKLIAERIRALGHTARSVFAVAEKSADQVTLDLLTQRMQVHEKTAWMLRSLLE